MHFDPEIARVLYASDDTFAQVLGVSLVSLYRSNTDMKDIILYILDGGMAEENKKKIEAVCKSFNRSFPVWIDASDISRILGIAVKTDRGSVVQFARIFISHYADAGRIIYLDCDVLIRKSIRELWTMDLQGKTIGAMRDAFSRYYRKNIGLQSDEEIFNSGVMVIDLERWESLDVKDRTLDVFKTRNGKVIMGDQGALNAALHGDVTWISPKYNAVTIFFDFSYREMIRYRQPPAYYSEQEIFQAVEDPAIVHFTVSFLSYRPWEKGCRHRYAEEWLLCKAMSPWKDEPLCLARKSKVSKFLASLPRPMMLFLASILQVYVRPICWMVWR